MINRRSFLKQTSKASLGGLLMTSHLPALFSQAAMPAPGLQLYTFFSSIDSDVNGTLKKIADIGYKNIESAFSRKGGYYGLKPKEFATLLNGMGLSWKSHHVLGAPFKLPPNAKPPVDASGKPISIPPMKTLRDNYQELVDDAAAGGVEYLVCANTPISTMEDVKASIATLNKTGEAAAKAGIQFAFHNHDAEFRPVEGKVPYELFLSETDPKQVKMELDVAWAIKGGADPVALFNKHPNRFPLWHIKDLDPTREKVLPLGEGNINFKPVFEAAATSGMKYYFIEHDMPADALKSITTSFANLKKLIV